MRDSQDIKVTKAVIHLVDPQGPNGFKCSKAELPVKGNKDIVDFIARHIQHALTDKAARAARFVEEEEIVEKKNGGEPLAATCGPLVHTGRGFLPTSVGIATELNSILKRNKSISGCALVVCMYRATTATTYPRFLGILKMDQLTAFQPKFDAKLGYVTFTEIGNVMPMTDQRLQKAAFIKPSDDADDYDMLLIDRQRSGTKEPARFFTKDFLGVEAFEDERAQTKGFNLGVVKAIDRIKNDVEKVNPKQLDKLRVSADVALGQDEIDVEDWISQQPIPPQARTILSEEIGNLVTNPVVTVDRNESEGLLKRRVYTGDFGFRLSFNSDPEVKKFIVDEGPDEIDDMKKGTVTRLVLHVKDFTIV